MDNSARVRAILDELDNAARAYQQFKTEYDIARVHFEMARERFGRLRDQASQMLTPTDWGKWLGGHPFVRYASADIRIAVVQVLADHALDQAVRYVEGKVPKYAPALSLDQIATYLESGGYEFKTSSPPHEVAGGLIGLNGVTRTPEDTYRIDDPEQYLVMAKEWITTGAIHYRR